MKVVIIGGGVTGMFSAYYLLKKGHEVILIDDNLKHVPTSTVNAGLIVPSEGAVPTMGFAEILGSYIGRQSPIYISIGEVVRNIGWFRVGMRRGLHGFEKILRRFGEESLELYDDFFEEAHTDVDVRGGVVSLYKNGEFARRAAAELPKARFVAADEISRMGFTNLSGGIFFEEERSVNPSKLFDALRSRISDLGVRLVLGSRAGLRSQGGHVVSVHAAGEDFAAERFLIAAGSWSRILSQSVGYDIPVLPARGMGMIFETGGEELVNTAAMLEDVGIAVSQHDANTFRLTSYFELVGFNESFGKDREKWLLKRASHHIQRFKDRKPTQMAVGFRPCTPDQLPIVGRLPHHDNLYIATGNCRLGVTLAPATGRMVGAMMEEEGRTHEVAVERTFWSHFDPARFRR